MPYATADDGSGGARLESLARTALTAYDLPGTPTLRPLAFGLNATFEVRAGSTRYVLRVHRNGYRTADQIGSELEFVRAISIQLAGDPAVPEPVPARDGALVVETQYDGEHRYCDLLTWLDGQTPGLDNDGVWALGRALGRLHNASAAFQPPAGFSLPRWDADGMFKPAASPFRPTLAVHDLLTPADRTQYAEIAARTRAAFEALGTGEDAYGITHIDYILGNCFLHPGTDGFAVSIFDFDDCGWGYFAYDLCPLLGNLAGYPGPIQNNPAYPDLRDTYFAGYRTARPLPAEWEALVPLMLAARNANHCLLTARADVSNTPAADAAWRMGLARRCLELPV